MKRLLSAATVFVFCASAATASVVASVSELSGDIIAEFTGSLDLTGAIFESDGIALSGAHPTSGTFSFGADAVRFYQATGPAAIGPGGSYLGASGSGDQLYLSGGTNRLGVPASYTSGVPLSGSLRFIGESFVSLGLTIGTYTYNIPNDTVTLYIGTEPDDAPAVPLPAGLPLMLAGLGAFGLIRRKSA